jgi:hypothetical protein
MPGTAEQTPLDGPPQLLEQIGNVRAVQQQAEAGLALLVDQAVNLAIGWLDIASRLGGTRQAASQHYPRRHRAGADLER